MDSQDLDAVQVACLSNVLDIQRACQREGLKLTQETNDYLLYLTLKKLGPVLAQKLMKQLVSQGSVAWEEDEEFEVESVLDHAVEEDDKHFYLIKWKGWAHEHNTWEPKEHLECKELIAQFHEGRDRSANKRSAQAIETDTITKKQKIDDIFTRITQASEPITPLHLIGLSKSPNHKTAERIQSLITGATNTKRFKRRSKSGLLNKRSKAYKDLQREIQVALKRWEDHLNTINTDPAGIAVENNVDLEGPPTKFQYLNDYKAGPDIIIPDDPIVGCECENCVHEKKNCCGRGAGHDMAYTSRRRVRVPPGHPIYECNKRCKCGPDCPNRVVQHGRKVRVCVFRTSNGRGWGIKTMQKISKGTFVMEYVGEVITNEEAERRGKTYDAEGMTYLFDLDYNDADCPFTVDAGVMGNVAHFINHSCDPNLAVYAVWINNLDPRLPRIALFASKDINKGEELTFDYMMTGDTTRTMVNPAESNQATPTENSLITPKRNGFSPSPQSNNQFIPPSSPVSAKLNNKEDVKRTLVESEKDNDMNDVMNQKAEMDQEQNETVGETDSNKENSDTPVSPSPLVKYRIMCQCGAAKCRKYLC